MPSNRSDILADIATTLAAIATPTYNTDVATVSRVYYSPDEFRGKAGPLPGLCFWPARKQPKPTNLPFDQIEKELVVWIAGFVEATTIAARSEAIGELQDDCRRILCNDYPLRDGLGLGSAAAVDTIEWEPEETDEGIEDCSNNTGDIGVFQFAVKCLYYPDD